MSVARQQRWSKATPCVICGGFDQAERGERRRCFGFLSSDGLYAHCTREERAGGLTMGDESQTYAHKLEGECRCGRTHGPAASSPAGPRGSRIVATYPYRDEAGELLFEVVRFDPKSFRQRRPHPTRPGEWLWSLDGCRRVPYRLPELRAAVAAGRRVHVVEGEKDAETAVAMKLEATTFPGGAGKFRPEYVEPLRGAHVVLHPDDDEPGRRHAEQVREALAPVVASLTVVPLPGAKDFAAWRAAGGTREQLEVLVAATGGPRLAWATAAELCAAAPEVVPWIARPYLAAATITEFDGVMKLGKTTWILALVAAILDGEPFLDEPTVKTPVVYLTEQPQTSFSAALRRAGLDTRADLHVLVWSAAARVAWPEVVADAATKAAAVGARVLIVDTFSQWARLVDENDAAAALAACAPIQEAVASGLAIVLVRHERKSGGEVGQAARGSSALGGVADIIVSLRRPEGRQARNFRVLHAVSRFDETPAQLVVEWTGRTYEARGTETNVATQAARAALLEEAPDEPELAVPLDAILARRPGVSKPTLKREARRLLEAGGLKTVGGGRRGDPLRYYRERGESGS